MPQNNSLKWQQILEYSGQVIIAGNVGFKKGFGLYKSDEGQLAWAPYKWGHEPHINPQDSVNVSSATKDNIGQILAEITQIELKDPYISADLMLRHNEDLVLRILHDLRGLR